MRIEKACASCGSTVSVEVDEDAFRRYVDCAGTAERLFPSLGAREMCVVKSLREDFVPFCADCWRAIR